MDSSFERAEKMFLQKLEDFQIDFPKMLESDMYSLPNCKLDYSLERWYIIYNDALYCFGNNVSKKNPLYRKHLVELSDVYNEEVLFSTKDKVGFIQKLIKINEANNFENVKDLFEFYYNSLKKIKIIEPENINIIETKDVKIIDAIIKDAETNNITEIVEITDITIIEGTKTADVLRITKHLDIIKDCLINDEDFNIIIELYADFFNNKTPEIKKNIRVKPRNIKKIAYTLGQLINNVHGESVKLEDLKFARNLFDIYKEMQIDDDNFMSSNLYKYFHTKPDNYNSSLK